jgi:hypothetical protein
LRQFAGNCFSRLRRLGSRSEATREGARGKVLCPSGAGSETHANVSTGCASLHPWLHAGAPPGRRPAALGRRLRPLLSPAGPRVVATGGARRSIAQPVEHVPLSMKRAPEGHRTRAPRPATTRMIPLPLSGHHRKDANASTGCAALHLWLHAGDHSGRRVTAGGTGRLTLGATGVSPV